MALHTKDTARFWKKLEDEVVVIIENSVVVIIENICLEDVNLE